MLLGNKTAIMDGAGGAVGGVVARTFAREGAKVFLSGRTLSKVKRAADEIVAAGGTAEAFQVDALSEEAVESHVAKVFDATGRLDVSFNAITAVPQPGTQGIPIAQLSVDAFTAPITLYMRSHFPTARAAARRMAEQGSGVLLMNTPEPARLGLTRVGGMGPAWAAMEGLNRNLSAEFGANGVRAICIRSSGMPETETIDVVYGTGEVGRRWSAPLLPRPIGAPPARAGGRVTPRGGVGERATGKPASGGEGPAGSQKERGEGAAGPGAAREGRP